MMALYRAFSVGRFKCSGIIPKIVAAEYLGDGYVLKIKKNSTTKFCLNCVEHFFNKKGLRFTQDKNYTIIQSPLKYTVKS